MIEKEGKGSEVDCNHLRQRGAAIFPGSFLNLTIKICSMRFPNFDIKIDHLDQYDVYTLEVLPDGCSNSILTRLAHCTTWPEKVCFRAPDPVSRMNAVFSGSSH